MMNKMTITDQYTDAEVINKILDGDKALFEILIRRNNPFLYKTGRSYGYNHEDTQDLMQETFISSYVHLSTFDHRSTFKTWIIKIMLRHCYRKQKKFSYKNEMSMAIDDNLVPMYSDKKQNDIGKEVVNRELNHVIENTLMQVPEDYRMVFSLREINGLSVAETSEAMDISEANVKVRLNRAKVMLRKELEKTYTAEEIFDFNLVYCDSMVDRVMNMLNKLD